MNADQMQGLAVRLHKQAQIHRQHFKTADQREWADTLDAAANLIESMAQRELVECTACGAEVVRVPGKYDRQNTIAADELPQILREYGRACERAAYERAAKQCLIVRHNSPADLTYQEGCTDCADAIRTLDKSDHHGPDWTTRDGEYLK